MFWERFYALCISKGTKPNPISQEIGVSSGTLTKWKDGKTFPNGETLIKIANYFNCSVDYLLGLSDTPFSSKSKFSKDEWDFFSKFHLLDSTNKEEILMLIDLKLHLQEKRKETSSSFLSKSTQDKLA